MAFVLNDARSLKLNTNEAIAVRPQGNADIVTGNFLGKLALFSLVNLIFILCSATVNGLFYPRSFHPWAYLFYWLTLTFPTLVGALGLSFLVQRITRNQGLGLLLLFVLLGGLTLYGAGWIHGLLDPCARQFPNLFSDFTGHTDTGTYLLQRGFILLAGIAMLILSIIPYRRLPNSTSAKRKCAFAATLPTAAAILLAMGFLSTYHHADSARTRYRLAYQQHASQPVAYVVSHDITISELDGGNIEGHGHLLLRNKQTEDTPLVLYLNPGLAVSSIAVNGEDIPFTRSEQVIIIDQSLAPGDSCTLDINYSGKVTGDICYLYVPDDLYRNPGNHSKDIYRFGQETAFCEQDYKLFTPECLWYPVTLPPHHENGQIPVQFSRYSLTVNHDPSLTAISQGHDINRNTPGQTTFHFRHDMPALSLCIGNYAHRQLLVDSIRMEVFYNPQHEFLLDAYPVSESEAESIISNVRNQIENNSWDADPFDLTLGYPYRWATLVETPCQFHAFPNPLIDEGEREQAGIVFIPERLCSVDRYEYKTASQEKGINYLKQAGGYTDLLLLVQTGSCSLIPSLNGRTTYLANTSPVLTDILDKTRKSIFHFTMTGLPQETAYRVTRYLNRHNLQEAIEEAPKSLLPTMLTLKGFELSALVYQHVDMKTWQAFYHDFLIDHLFQDVDARVLYQQVHDNFGFRLDSLIEKWFLTNRIPVFDIRDAYYFILDNEYSGRFLHSFKVLNRGELPGILLINDKPIVIPPHEGKEVRIPMEEEDGIATIYSPLAQNFPLYFSFEPSFAHPKDTSGGIFDIDTSCFALGHPGEIIVDNESPGFRVIEAGGWKLASLFKPDKADAYHNFAPHERWYQKAEDYHYGYPIRSAYEKNGGKGEQKVEWFTPLADGEYEVFFYRGKDKKGYWPAYTCEYHYTIFDGKENHEVIARFQNDEADGWISLGTFHFTGEGRVTLSDKDRTHKEGESISGSQHLVADAIKWVKIDDSPGE